MPSTRAASGGASRTAAASAAAAAVAGGSALTCAQLCCMARRALGGIVQEGVRTAPSAGAEALWVCATSHAGGRGTKKTGRGRRAGAKKGRRRAEGPAYARGRVRHAACRPAVRGTRRGGAIGVSMRAQQPAA